MFKFAETPNAFSNVTGKGVRLFNGDDGLLYFGTDVENFAENFPHKTRSTKYGVNYYFDTKPSYQAIYEKGGSC